jgi:integrase/recombinase XerD
VIPISKKLLDVLKRLPRTSNLVFPDPRGGGFWRYDITALVKMCAKRAGIEKNVYTHALRHTFATHLRRRGVPLETLKELLGHANIQETLIYAHFSPEEARAAIPKIDFF